VTRGARVLLLGPYVLLLAGFFLAPLLLMLAVSFSRQSFGQLEWSFTPQHYIHFFSDAYYVGVLGDTLWLGLITTAVSLLLGYPLAYHLALTRSRWKPLLIVCILSPLLVGIVIRCYGWMILLADRGLINESLVRAGWITKPLPLMYNKFGVTLALVHVFLPFMVLSLTGVLKRIEPQLIEASQTLGASPRRAFFEVTLPLSLPGILAGSLLVFSLAISSPKICPLAPGGSKCGRSPAGSPSHACSISPSIPRPCSGPSSGPVMNPSSDIDMSRTMLPTSGALRRRSLDALGEVDGHGVAGGLVDGLAQRGAHRQLVPAVAEGHERALEGLVVDGAAHLHQATRAEELGRVRHHHVGVPALGRTLLQRRGERAVERAHGIASTTYSVLPSASRNENIGGTPGQSSIASTSTPRAPSAA